MNDQELEAQRQRINTAFGTSYTMAEVRTVEEDRMQVNEMFGTSYELADVLQALAGNPADYQGNDVRGF